MALRRVRASSLVALRVCAIVWASLASPRAAAHGGESLLCMPFVWLLDGYTRCVLACLDCSGACCGPSRAASSDAADDAPRPEPPPPASAPEGDGGDAPSAPAAPDADEPGRAGDAAVPPVRY